MLSLFIPDGRFEPLAGMKPDRVLDRHPDGIHAAMQMATIPLNRAAVWHTETGELCWSPRHTSALCWLPGGRELVLLRERYARSPRISRWSQSETTYVVERRTWPRRQRLSSCEVSFPSGWADGLTLSPTGDMAAVRWLEQDCAGFVLVALGPGRDHQLSEQGYRTEPNLIEGPVFSPDGRHLALSCGRTWWWCERDWQRHADTPPPSKGGRFEIGHVTIYDVAQAAYQEIVVEDEISPGWPPHDPDSFEWVLLGEPRFVSDTAFTVRLPTGAERRFETTLPS